MVQMISYKQSGNNNQTEKEIKNIEEKMKKVHRQQ